MLLGLLSIVTGATSVKGMDTQQLVAYDKAMSGDAIPADFKLTAEDLAKFNTLSEEEKAKIATKIATLYVCVQIKNGSPMSSLVSGSGEVTLNKQKVQLSNEQESFVRSYFSDIAASKAGQPTSSTQPQKPGFSIKKKIAIAAATALVLATAYVTLGNMYHDANCTVGSNSALCASTTPADAAAAYALTALTAAGTGLATAGIAIKTLAQKLYAKVRAQYEKAKAQWDNTPEDIGYSCSDRRTEVENLKDCPPLAPSRWAQAAQPLVNLKNNVLGLFGQSR